jgi:hypothetical protein
MPGPPTDVEISRALNALATTIADQRYEAFELERFQQIVDGALSGERKLVLHRAGDASGFVARADDGLRIADVELVDGSWQVERLVNASGSEWAQPQ